MNAASSASPLEGPTKASGVRPQEVIPQAVLSAPAARGPAPSTRPLRVLIADDDHDALVATRAALLAAGFSVECVHEAHAVGACLNAHEFDALVLGLEISGDLGLGVVRELGQQGHMLAVVLLAKTPALPSAIEALRLGVADYLSKPVDADELVARVLNATDRVHALRSLEHVANHVSRLAATLDTLRGRLARDLAPTSTRSANDTAETSFAHLGAQELNALSKREREVLTLLAKGQQAREIGGLLGVSTNTVRNHIRSLFVKLRVKSQIALMARLAGGSATR